MRTEAAPRPRLWRLTWAEWRTHPWRQLAALLSVALGVALALAVHLINESALAEFSSAVRSANGEPDLRLVGGAQGLPDEWADRLAVTAGVAVAHPRIEREALWLPPDGRRPRALQVLGVDGLSVGAVAPELFPRAAEGECRLAMLDSGLVFVNPALQQALGGAAELRLLAGGARQAWRVAGHVAAPGGPLAVAQRTPALALLGVLGLDAAGRRRLV